MKTSKQLPSFDIRSIHNGYVVTTSPELRRGTTLPQEQFAEDLCAVGDIVADICRQAETRDE